MAGGSTRPSNPPAPRLFEGAVLLPRPFKNFEGREGQYNRLGEKNFCILLEPEVAEEMERDLWNVKKTKDRGEGPDLIPGQPYIQVNVSYKGKPPRVQLRTSRNRKELDEDGVGTLDWIDIANIDVIINPFWFDVGGNTGYSAYLKTAFVTMNEDYLELKYALLDEEENQTPGGSDFPADMDGEPAF